MAEFKVGDVCEVIGHMLDGSRSKWFGFVGAVVEVGRRMEDSLGCIRDDGVQLSFMPRGENIPPERLLLKRPPSYPDQFTAGEWDLIPWKPAKERA